MTTLQATALLATADAFIVIVGVADGSNGSSISVVGGVKPGLPDDVVASFLVRAPEALEVAIEDAVG